jgi:hypothetical protein
MAEERTEEFAALVNALIRDEAEIEQNAMAKAKQQKEKE